MAWAKRMAIIKVRVMFIAMFRFRAKFKVMVGLALG
jgi:hypothetical protein